ncbi:replication/maintenance protein RepL [Cohnella sp. AR92]|uniref:replication/maintenance protein RepL n=1 Tax=Cohnella sp. AR92 TaxID=648716 RepID=UPI000F8E6D91|nr:replication/maintenance protein RepL [Cohnella sp. AR92]RUS47614.1 hypothetical protein ELR57_07445 [Cohnella sp. AR92]
MSSAIRKEHIGLINNKTGEIYDKTLAQYEREQKAQKAANAYKWANKHEEKFVFARMEAVPEIKAVLTRPQRGLFLVLQTYVDYEGILRNPAWLKQNKTAMTNQDMIEALGISKQTFSDFMKNCLDNNIIIKTDTESYKLNSKYHFRGKQNKGDNTVKIWNTEVRNMMRKIKWADLGLLYDLIPYIHLQTNTLCENPYEADPTKLKKLNQKQVCELLGISKPTFNRLLDMEYGGKVVLAEIRKKRQQKSYLVNPWIFYRMDGIPNDDLLDEKLNPYKPDATLLSIFSSDNAKK